MYALYEASSTSAHLPPDQPPNIRFPEHPAKLPPAKKPRSINQFNAKPPPPIKETLLDLQLIPQSVLLVRFDEDDLNRELSLHGPRAPI